MKAGKHVAGLAEDLAGYASKNSPPQPRRGGRDIKETIAKHPHDRSGRGGVGQEIVFLANTTPSARADVASRLFLVRAATPPRLRRGMLGRISSGLLFNIASPADRQAAA